MRTDFPARPFPALAAGRRTISVAVALFALLSGAAQTRAAVLEIGPDGALIRHDAPAQFLTPDLIERPIQRAQPRGLIVQSRSRPSAEVAAALTRASAAAAIDQALLDSVAWQESRFNPKAISRKGAVGVMQLMPRTANRLGVDAAKASDNVSGGARYMRLLLARYDGDIVKSLAAYNAGPAAVDRYGGVPPYAETRAFVDAVLQRLAERALDARAPENGIQR
jgi:soluble lytic murein transglycosylase-like protein